MLSSRITRLRRPKAKFLAAMAAASVALGAAAAPAGAQLVYDSGYWGHANCELNPGGGVYVKDGTSEYYYDSDGHKHKISCKNGKLTNTVVARTNVGGLVPIKGGTVR